MNILLDTRVLLWWLNDDKQLNERARGLIGNTNNVIFVSSASAWEISIKKALGKLKVPDNLSEALAANQFFPLNISIEHALLAGKLKKIHDDPFDRMLVAQARTEGLSLMTRDKILRQYKIPLVLV